MEELTSELGLEDVHNLSNQDGRRAMTFEGKSISKDAEVGRVLGSID